MFLKPKTTQLNEEAILYKRCIDITNYANADALYKTLSADGTYKYWYYDKNANKIATKVESLLAENGNDYKAVVEQLGGEIIYEETGGLVDGKNIDGGRASEAMKLEPGQSSGRFVSMNGDGYYFVKLINKTDSEVNFVSIKVPFTEFAKQFDALKADGKIIEYIDVSNPVEEQ